MATPSPDRNLGGHFVANTLGSEMEWEANPLQDPATASVSSMNI